MLKKQLSRLILSLGFIVAIVSLQAEEKSEPLFDGAPKDSEGRFTNTNGDLSHGSAAVRAPFSCVALVLFCAVILARLEKFLMMVICCG